MIIDREREIECLWNDNHQKGKMMIMIMKTSGSQVDSPVDRNEGADLWRRELFRNNAQKNLSLTIMSDRLVNWLYENG